MSGYSTSISGTTGTYTDGTGNEIYVDARYGGDDRKMMVRITEIDPTSFGRAIGQDTITVTQEAICATQSVRTGVPMVPIGALPGSWNGDLFDCAAKVTGNCGALSPDGGGANAYRDAVANGIAGDFIKHHGNQNVVDPDTGFATVDCFAFPCNVSRTEPGNMVGPWNQGLTTRFSDISGADCVEAGSFNCDSINQVFGAGLQNLSAISQPPWWEDSLYGTFAAAQSATNPDAQHYFYNGSSMKCDSPRIATVPIVVRDQNWDLGDPRGNWPNGRKDMKFIGFYTIYIREPSSIAAIGGPIDADVIWFGPNAQCDDGSLFQPFGSNNPINGGVWLEDS